MVAKVLKFQATLTIEDADALIGPNDQARRQFWEQVRNHSVLHVNGDLGEGVGTFSDIRVTNHETEGE